MTRTFIADNDFWLLQKSSVDAPSNLLMAIPLRIRKEHFANSNQDPKRTYTIWIFFKLRLNNMKKPSNLGWIEVWALMIFVNLFDLHFLYKPKLRSRSGKKYFNVDLYFGSRSTLSWIRLCIELLSWIQIRLTCMRIRNKRLTNIQLTWTVVVRRVYTV